MHIAYVGGDHFANCAEALLGAGHTIARVYASSARGFAAPLTIDEVVQRHGLAVQHAPVARDDLERLQEEVELLVCAGYPRRLPVRPGDRLRAINVHPSPLPEGRGPSPYAPAILRGLDVTAITVHELTERFDAGPILAQRPLPVLPRDTAVSLMFRCRAEAAPFLVDVLGRFEEFWAGRREQGPGSYWHKPGEADRTIRFDSTVGRIDRQLRAFAPGSLHAVIEGKRYAIDGATCWTEAHAHRAGAVVGANRGERLIAALDGYVYVRRTTPLWLVPWRDRAAQVMGRLG